MIEHNSFRNDKVQNLRTIVDGQEMSVGVLESGRYIFNNEKTEIVKIIKGTAIINSEEYSSNGPKSECVVRAGEGVNFFTEETILYYCIYE